MKKKKEKGDVLVLTAGTSDIPVAEEAAVTSFISRGSKVETVYDVGVAGLQTGCLIKSLFLLPA